jgi:MFS family permease
MATGIGVGLAWYGAFVFGGVWLFLTSRGFLAMRANDVPGPLLWLPLVAVVAQLPLWIARFWFRWTIVVGPALDARQEHRALGIRDMLVFTGVVAAALSATRMSFPATGIAVPREYGFVLLMVVAIFALMSLFVTMPVLLVTLSARRLKLTLPVLVLSYAGIAYGALTGVAKYTRTPAQLLALGSLAGGCFACLIGVLLAARWFGVRLVWGRPRDANLGSQISDLKSEITDRGPPDLPVSTPSSPSQGGS